MHSHHPSPIHVHGYYNNVAEMHSHRTPQISGDTSRLRTDVLLQGDTTWVPNGTLLPTCKQCTTCDQSPLGFWSNKVHHKGNRVPFGTEPTSNHYQTRKWNCNLNCLHAACPRGWSNCHQIQTSHSTIQSVAILTPRIILDGSLYTKWTVLHAVCHWLQPITSMLVSII